MLRLLEVFPVCAGMSRQDSPDSFSGMGVPRMCGDEPNPSIEDIDNEKCSPYVRG